MADEATLPQAKTTEDDEDPTWQALEVVTGGSIDLDREEAFDSLLTPIVDKLRDAVGHLADAASRLATTTSIVVAAIELAQEIALSRLGRKRQLEEGERKDDPLPKRKRSQRDDEQPLLLRSLSSEILTHIFTYLDPSSLASLSLVSSEVRNIADRLPWRRHFGLVGLSAFYPRHMRAQGTRGSDFWKDAIVKARSMQAKWARGGIQRSLAGHDKPINGLCILQDGRCITSDSHVIKEWDIDKEVMVDSFRSESRIVCFAADDSHLMISSSDEVRVYDTKSKIYLFTLGASVSTISTMHLYGRWIAGGSWDGYIRTYAKENGSVVSALIGHQNPVYCLDHHKTRIVSGSSDRTIKLWDPETESCIITFRGHSKTVQAIKINMNAQLVISGSRDCTVRIWDTRMSSSAPHSVRTLDEHSDAVTAVQVDCAKIVSAGKDSTIRVWDLRTRRPMYSFQAQPGGINCMEFVDDVMISAGDDKLVKIWKF